MTDLKPDEDLTQPMVKSRPEDTIFQAPYSAPPAPEKPADPKPAKPAGKPAEKDDDAFSWSNPLSKDASKPAKKSRDDMTPVEKAADTRAKNERAEKREAQAAEKAVGADESAESAGQRTWSCPLCGRGTTLGASDQPPTIMRCDGCGRDVMGDTWLAPGFGHGEPTLPVGHER